MPEAAVHEDHPFPLFVGEIWLPRQAGNMHPVANPKAR
jgi:hypothetical protein